MRDAIDDMVRQGLLSEKQASAARQRGEELVKRAADACPFELHEYAEKTAVSPFLDSKNWAPPLIGLGLAAGLRGGAAIADHIINRVQTSKDKAQGYKDMLAANPDLTTAFDADKVQRAFDTLHTLNPTYAKDPLIAASFVERVMINGTPRDSVSSMQIPISDANAVAQSRRSFEGSGNPGPVGSILGPVPNAMFSYEPDALQKLVDSGHISPDDAQAHREQEAWRYGQQMHAGYATSASGPAVVPRPPAPKP